MRAKLTGTDAYLEQWRRAEPVPCGDDLEAEAAAAAEAWRPSTRPSGCASWSPTAAAAA